MGSGKWMRGQGQCEGTAGAEDGVILSPSRDLLECTAMTLGLTSAAPPTACLYHRAVWHPVSWLQGQE